MTYWRDGEHVYFHGASKGRFAQACTQGDICLTVSHFDGLVLGHSAFNHSFNYRSVVLSGRAEMVEDHDAKTAAMQAFVERIVPGRWPLLRPIRDSEIRAITLLRLKIEQVSAKVREGWPDEESVDPDWPVWVGVLPAETVFGTPLPDPLRNRAALPDHVAQYAALGARQRFD